MVVQQATPKLLTLGVPAARSAMARDHLPEIVRIVQEIGAGSMSIQIVDIKPTPTEAATPRADAEAQPSPSGSEQTGPDADEHPLVQQAARIFGAKVTHIHPKRR